MSGDLVKALQRLYETETNINISSFWDSGWTVKLGDELNGYVAERTFHNDELGELANWIEGQGAKASERVGVAG
jgi:hypothetical protein